MGANAMSDKARHEKRWHVHGCVRIQAGREAWVSVSVDAPSEEQAQRYAWLVCPELDVQEIELEEARA
jgi:hypothetical protein